KVLSGLSSKAKIRNVLVVALANHSKSTLTDSSVCKAGTIVSDRENEQERSQSSLLRIFFSFLSSSLPPPFLPSSLPPSLPSSLPPYSLHSFLSPSCFPSCLSPSLLPPFPPSSSLDERSFFL
uniref:Uncharacterized protein n=1 Tax=Melopsittacus undulatus TaxID=13146 RepID=A0A8V5HFL3_MELUD